MSCCWSGDPPPIKDRQEMHIDWIRLNLKAGWAVLERHPDQAAKLAQTALDTLEILQKRPDDFEALKTEAMRLLAKCYAR